MGIEIQEFDKKEDGPDKLVFTRKEKEDLEQDGIELFPSSLSDEDKRQEALERQQELEKLDQKLQLEKFKDLVLSLNNGSYQIETDVSGETHVFTLERFYKGEQPIKDNTRMVDDLEQEKTTLDQFAANFTCVKIKGRPEPLKLNFKTSVIELLSGSTDLAEKIKQTFAGTEHHRKMYENQKQQEQSEEQEQQNQQKVGTIENILREKKYDTSIITYENGPVIISGINREKGGQITISTMGGAVWTLSTIGSDGNENSTQLAPNELIETVNSGEL